MKKAVIAAMIVVNLPVPAFAQWTGKAEAGVLAARGNSDSDSANAKFDVTREFIKWRQSVGATGVYASDAAGATGQRWELRGQSDYDFHTQGFWFASGRDQEDRSAVSTKVHAMFLIESGRENTFIQSDLSLQVTVISSLALALGYSVRYNTDPPSGFNTTDTLTTFNLVYELD